MKISMYHGTSKKRGDQILNDGMLKATSIKRVYDDDHPLPSTDGYIYLTNDIALAVYYANKTSYFSDEDEQLMIFKIEMEKESLKADIDEINMTHLSFWKDKSPIIDKEKPTLDESLAIVSAARFPNDIILKEFDVQHMIETSTFSRNSSASERVFDILTARNSKDEYSMKEKEAFLMGCKWENYIDVL
ncbi:hypothetical protein [Psychrobacillus sp.]|uniref:hypothetical protein n=1 Tax=Psychrobacillus sp. TaxID=1871623 RepID=UPI0028BE2628|nr:hypothetical protein [Psychrobacillus sp.]